MALLATLTLVAAPIQAAEEAVARALKLLLDERIWLDFDAVPGEEANEDGQPVSLGTIMDDGQELEVTLVREGDDWVVSSETVQGVPAMAKTMGVWWITSLPEFLVDVHVAEIELWQWIALQAQANLSGGASVIADRVLHPGDTCSINGTIATVERIGLRSTTLRTVDRTQLLVAKSDLAQSCVEKLSSRDGFRFSAVIGVRHETSGDAMRRILTSLRARLESDALVDPASVRVHFMAFGASSLDIDLKAVVKTTDAAVYRTAVERINLDVMDIVQSNGTGFAFPSQTVYVARDRS